MKHTPTVSIIIIFFNEERFLPEAVESVLSQRYPDWELLLVDDGSRDNSTKMAQDYARKYPGRIRYLHHEGHQNRGMSATRNLGIGQAKGEYIGFLDADDLWLPDKLQEQVSIMQQFPEAALVCGRAQWWYSWKKDLENQDFLQQFPLSIDQLISPPQVLLMFLEDQWTSLCDVLIRTDVIQQVGGYEAVFKGMYEDQAFHAKICLNHPVYLSGACGYRYRQHADSCCAVAQKTGKERIARALFLNWLEAYLAQQKQVDDQVRRALKKAMWKHNYPYLSSLHGKAVEWGVAAGRRILPGAIRQWLWDKLMT